MNTGSAALDCFDLTDTDRGEVEDILDAAAAWKAGSLPIHEFARLGQIVSPANQRSAGYSRYVAFRTTPRSDFRYGALVAAIAAVKERQDVRLASDLRIVA